MASKKGSHRPPAKKKSSKKPVAYVEFTDSTSSKKGSKKPVAMVEYKKPPKKK
jgi:hypothetical protein